MSFCLKGRIVPTTYFAIRIKLAATGSRTQQTGNWVQKGKANLKPALQSSNSQPSQHTGSTTDAQYTWRAVSKQFSVTVSFKTEEPTLFAVRSAKSVAQQLPRVFSAETEH